MTWLGVSAVTALALAAGCLIGCVGIGGVILVPALAYVGGYSVHTAIAAAMASYVVSAAIGTFAYWRAGSVPWAMARPLCVAAMPSALVGALVSSVAPTTVLEAVIGVLTVASGLNTWREQAHDSEDGHSLTPVQLSVAGVVTGFASALTGTGGPLVLVPILMWLRCPVILAVGMALVIQMPIALLATAANAMTGSIDLTLALLLSIGLAVGTWGGAHIAHMVPRSTLRLIMACVQALVGVAILVKVVARLVG